MCEPEYPCELINLTPNSINIYSNGKVIKTIESSGVVKCQKEIIDGQNIIFDFGSVDTGKDIYGKIIGLPKGRFFRYYIVPIEVARVAWELGRLDVVCPLNYVYDENGEIIGIDSLATSPCF